MQLIYLMQCVRSEALVLYTNVHYVLRDAVEVFAWRMCGQPPHFPLAGTFMQTWEVDF